MARFTVVHNEPIWETTTFEVDVPDDCTDPIAYIRENVDELMAEAFETGDAAVESGDRIESMDSDIAINDATGLQVYSDLDDDEIPTPPDEV